MSTSNNATPDPRRVVSNAVRMLSLVWHSSPGYGLVTVVLTAVTAAVTPAQIWLTKTVIDRVEATASSGVPTEAGVWYRLLEPLAGVFVVWVLGVVCQSLGNQVRELVAFRTRIRTERLILTKAAQLDVAFFETPAFHDRLARAHGASHHAHNFAVSVLEFAMRLLSLGVLLGLLAQLHALAVVVLLVTAAPLTVVLAWSANRKWRLLNDNTPARRMSRYVAGLLASRGAVKEIRLFGLYERFLGQFVGFWMRHFEQERRIRMAGEAGTVGVFLLAMAGVAGIWLFAIVQAVHGRIGLGDVAMAFQASEQARGTLAQMFLGVGRFYEICVFADNLFLLLDTEPGSVAGALDRRGSEPAPMPITGGIEFRRVSFGYAGGEGPVLRELSFVLRPGERVAVVGQNGAGKTTLVKLLARLHDPVEGEIRVDGRDLRDIDPRAWWREVGVIFQDFLHYHLSVRENIGFGRVERVDDRAAVRKAADEGGALPLVEGLPRGFETVLGRTFDGGVDLSGGEWQKLALSRAFMRQAQVLILDEPTAALDALAERAVYERFAELAAGRTTVFISHRFSTVRMADHILVLKDGRLVEEGSHSELMATRGHYAEMFTAQAEQYR